MFTNRIIRRPEVLHLTGLTGSALDREMRAGRIPRGIPLVPGGRAVGWSLAAIQAWIDAKAAEQGRSAA
jgi:prophage regulatory protein